MLNRLAFIYQSDDVKIKKVLQVNGMTLTEVREEFNRFLLDTGFTFDLIEDNNLSNSSIDYNRDWE